jgi:hypothetical protein
MGGCDGALASQPPVSCGFSFPKRYRFLYVRPQLNRRCVVALLSGQPAAQPNKEFNMRSYVLAIGFVVAFVTPAFAEEFYVAFDPASHKCEMMHSQPTAGMKMLGKYKTEAEAKKAMADMKECKP